ncbi:MAG: NAD-dependent epimerase/dehydratase family protein [Thaumarchaeota archaeon]|nr:NAD-dependent epimerase/dehydratase family protein [Nitrososphaerota archaeon]
MKYVLTGGAGFIGSHLARMLLQQGHAVDIIDNLSTGNLSNLSEIKDRIKFHNADIRNGPDMKKILAGKDGIFHHAALTSVTESYLKEKEYLDVNVQGTKNVFEAARETGTKVVFASSSGVYGNTDMVPTPESAKPNPANPYGITKLQTEILAQEYREKFNIVGLRYYNVYGDNPAVPSAGVISKFYKNISKGKPPVIDGDGLQIRDFVFVGDVAKATISAMEKNTGSVFINIGSGAAISILDLANLFIKFSKKSLNLTFEREPEGNVRASQADISLAKGLLGWKPEAKLEEWVESLFKK